MHPPSKELEAFIEYITVTKGLSPKSVEAYRNDLIGLEERLEKPLVRARSEVV